jgi:hypothetical protein
VLQNADHTLSCHHSENADACSTIVSSVPSSVRVPSITARPSVDEKRRFAELASSRGVSESTLALIAIRSLLDSNGLFPACPPSENRNLPSTDRITIRLRPCDRLAINERASRRSLKDSTYLAALVRAHVSKNPPLVADELATLKKAVAVLSALRSLLARACREASTSADIRRELHRTLVVVTAVEKLVHNLVRASIRSWESGYG